MDDIEQERDKRPEPTPAKALEPVLEPWDKPVPGYIKASMGVFSDMVTVYTSLCD